MKGQPVDQSDIPPPPWQLTSGSFACIGVGFDLDRIRPRIPSHFELTPGTTGGFYHYEARGGWGIAPYVAGLGYVDIEGYDAPDGTKAKFGFCGYFTARGHEGFSHYLGMDITLADAEISVTDCVVSATSGIAGEALRCGLRVTGDTAATPVGSGVNYWVWEAHGAVRGMACAFTSQFIDAEPLYADIFAEDHSPLAAFQPTSPPACCGEATFPAPASTSALPIFSDRP